DADTGALTFQARYRDDAEGVDGLDGVEGVAVSADGEAVYAVAADDGAVAVFARNPDDGSLTFLHRQLDGIGTVHGLVDPKAVLATDDGRVYVAATDADAVLVFDSACGDGEVAGSEQCDDGNTDAGDGCSPGCRVECETSEGCGDGDVCTEDRC